MKYLISVIRVIWLILSILILTFSTYRLTLLDSARDISELISIMCYAMMIISFPIGIVSFLALVFIGFILNIAGINIDNKYITTLILWLFFLTGGYLQWFVIINIIRKKSFTFL